MPTRGDFVWGKMKRFSWWPAILIHPEDCGRDRKTKEELWLFWFGDHKVSQLKCIQTVNFKENFAEHSKNMRNPLKNAIAEVLSVYAEQHHVQYTDFASLLNWANSGFQSISQVSRNRKRKIMELPNIVTEALQKDQFKRHCEEIKDEIDVILKDVRNDLKGLGDICIVCCQPKVKIILQHPLFVGGICQTCKKCITNVTKLEAGKIHNICVVCGQGGNLVYCSSQMCLRAYCKLCIDYLVSRESYLKILQNDDWRCYLCSNEHELKCLIQRREFHQAKPVLLPSLPNQKLPIRVIAQNNAVLSVIKIKKISVELYCTEPTYILKSSSAKYLQFYTDFTQQEFADICADFIYGSFFPSSDSQDRRHCLNSFASSFFKFLFRLDNAKLYNHLVFFIFVSEASVLDAESLSRVLRFLRVNPVSVELECKTFFVWCNIPHLKFNDNYKCLKRENKEPDEETIISKFIEPLKKYFQ